MTDSASSWGAGIVNHGSYGDLERCLASLASQSRRPAAIVVHDTGEDPARLETLRRTFPHVDFESGTNLGYAGGANRVVERLLSQQGPEGIAFALVLNPDVELDVDFAARLVDAVARAPRVAIATGKLLRPDRTTLDSAGIVFPRHRRPRDRGSEESDRGQYDATERVDAASGAAMLLRTAFLEDLALEGELFDESFFAYHEDTDLCWRARRLGYEILYEPSATALHARGWQRARRSQIDVAIRRHSFKNHYLQLVKNETPAGWVINAPWLLIWEVLRLGFVLLNERDLLPAYGDARRALPGAMKKRRLLHARARRVRG